MFAIMRRRHRHPIPRDAMTDTPHTPAAGHSGTPDDGPTPEEMAAFIAAADLVKPQTMPRRHRLILDNAASAITAFTAGLCMYPGNWGQFTVAVGMLAFNVFLHWAHSLDVEG